MNQHEAERQQRGTPQLIEDIVIKNIFKIHERLAARGDMASLNEVVGLAHHTERFFQTTASLHSEVDALLRLTGNNRDNLNPKKLSTTQVDFLYYVGLADRLLRAKALQDFSNAASRTSVGKKINQQLEKLKQEDLSVLFLQIKGCSFWQLFNEGAEGDTAKQFEFLHEGFLPSGILTRIFQPSRSYNPFSPNKNSNDPPRGSVAEAKNVLLAIQIKPQSNSIKLFRTEEAAKLAPQLTAYIRELSKTLKEVKKHYPRNTSVSKKQSILVCKKSRRTLS